MRKTVVFVILVLYVASIIFVGFFGMKLTVFEVTIPVTAIQLLNDDLKHSTDPDYTNYVKISLTTVTTYQIEWKVLPEDADHKTIEFIYDTSSPVASVTTYGTVTFSSIGTFEVTLSSTDGHNIKTPFMFIVGA